MTLLGFKIDGDKYAYYTVDINEDDNGFWDYYDEMRRESDGFVEDYRRSNQQYPKLRNLTRSSQSIYDALPEDCKLFAAWTWLDETAVH